MILVNEPLHIYYALKTIDMETALIAIHYVYTNYYASLTNSMFITKYICRFHACVTENTYNVMDILEDKTSKPDMNNCEDDKREYESFKNYQTEENVSVEQNMEFMEQKINKCTFGVELILNAIIDPNGYGVGIPEILIYCIVNSSCKWYTLTPNTIINIENETNSHQKVYTLFALYNLFYCHLEYHSNF